MSAEIFGSDSLQGLLWTAESLDADTRGRDVAIQPICAIGVVIAARLCTRPPPVVDSNELAGEPKSFSGTAGGQDEDPKW